MPVSVRTRHLCTNPWQILEHQLTLPRRRVMCHVCTVARATGHLVGCGADEWV